MMAMRMMANADDSPVVDDGNADDSPVVDDGSADDSLLVLLHY
jgi:hypothetical protein